MIRVESTKCIYNCNGCFDGQDQKKITATYETGSGSTSNSLYLCAKCRDELINKLTKKGEGREI